MEQTMQEKAKHASKLPDVEKFRFGAGILASDGGAGRLVAVVVDGQSRALTQVGIRVHQFDRHLAYVPLDRITSATVAGISLGISRQEIEAEKSAPMGITLTGSTRVKVSQNMGKSTTCEEPVGRLKQLTITLPSRLLRHVVAARHWHSAQLVPVDQISDVTSEQITIGIDSTNGRDGLWQGQPGRLQPYRSDEELRQEVFDKLYGYEILRVDLRGIEIHPIDGAVWLQGHVSSDGMRRLAAEEIEGITGLSAVHNELVGDDALAAAVAVALAHDQRTAGAGQYIGVYPRLGTIHLRGSVLTAAAREEAGTVAAGVPSVKQVVNELHIDPDALELHDLAGVTNQYDLVPGGR
jgi:osmotically-inducible protein OsmY